MTGLNWTSIGSWNFSASMDLNHLHPRPGIIWSRSGRMVFGSGVLK